MTILDQPDRWKSIDPQSMYTLVESFPEQIQAAAKSGQELVIGEPRNAKFVVVTGLGGSAIAGDLVRSIAGSRLRLPLIVNRDYDLPGFVDSSSMFVACSYSGNTEETLSAYRQARHVGASIFCITSGGQLESMAKADGYPMLRLPGGLPPRAALGYSLTTLLVVLQKTNIVPNMGSAIEEALDLLVKLRERYGKASPEASNSAKVLANSLHDKVVAVYGSSGMMDAVAFRWRTQIEENAKILALHQALPEMNHNELVGWKHPEDVLRRIGVVLLRDKGDHPQIQRRFDLTREVIAEKAGALHEIWSEGESPLSRVLSAIYLGDFVSVYMAYRNGTDPTPVEIIDFLKKNLAKQI
jgi:glucose/mannose-6-phosphate isomerase